MELWKITRHHQTYEKLCLGCGNEFFLVIKENNNNYFASFYTRDDKFEKFKFSFEYKRILRDGSAEERKNIFEEVLRYYLPYSGENMWGTRYDLTEFVIERIIKTDNEKVFNKKLEENDIVVLKKYECPVNEKKISSKLENKTSLSNIQVMDMIGSIKMRRVENAYVDDSPGYYTSSIIILNDNEPRPEFLYVDDEYSEWLKNCFYRPEDIKKQAIRCIISKPHIENSYEKTFMYVTCDNDKKISFKKIKITLEYDPELLIMNIFAKEEYVLDYELGKKINCTKRMKTKDRESNPFEMFKINSKTIRTPADFYVFEGSSCDYEFVLKNKEFFTRIGLFKLIGELDSNYSLLCVIILYIILIFDYPVIELLTKMGHTNLVEGIFSSLMNSSRKSDIVEKAKSLDQIINTNTTKGSLALRIPTYIGDYLIQNHCSLEEYKFWRDIYEIEGLSKEQFEEFINMPEKIILNTGMSKNSHSYYSCNWTTLGLPEILKYDGYTLIKTIKYCFKKHLEHLCDESNRYYSFYHTVNELKDTLLMAEELNFDLESYPENLQQIHNQLSKVKREKTDTLSEKKVKEIATQCEEYLKKVFSSNAVDLPKKAMEKFTYIFPATQQEFTQEGQNQHNCVAGYFSREQRGDCIVFFLREKENPHESFITAEITRRGIAQVMYSNNRPVPFDSEAFKYCKYIANKILHGIDMDEIKAIHKILH